MMILHPVEAAKAGVTEGHGDGPEGEGELHPNNWQVLSNQ